MWWLFSRKSEARAGKIVTGLCPYCNRQTQCQEVIKSSKTSVWFIPIAGGGEITGYVCLNCNNKFESFAMTPEERKNVRGCLTPIILIIVVMVAMFAFFGFNWWIFFGIPIVAFFIWVMTLEQGKSKNNMAKKYIRDARKKKYSETKFDRQVERNLKGIEYEKSGQIDKAIGLYEENVMESFDGSHPYTRLAIIYRRRNQIDNEIRVLRKAVFVYEKQYKEGINCSEDLQRFKKRLDKARELKKKKIT